MPLPDVPGECQNNGWTRISTITDHFLDCFLGFGKQLECALVFVGLRSFNSFEENVIIAADPRGMRWRAIGYVNVQCTNRSWSATVSIKAYRARGQLMVRLPILVSTEAVQPQM